mgnify:CR=1 FL=1
MIDNDIKYLIFDYGDVLVYPVTGNWFITSNFYKVFKGIEIAQESNQEVFLDIMLHLGTLIAVLIFFRKDIFKIIKALYFGIKEKKYDKEYKIENFGCKDLSYVKTGRYIDDVKHTVINPIFGPNYMSIENNNYKPLIVSGRYNALGEWIEFNVELEGNAETKLGIFVDEYEIYFIERPF